MPRASAVLVRLPSHWPRTCSMNRFSSSRTASSKRTPLFTIASTSFWSRSLITVELPAGEAAERLHVLVSRSSHDLVWQRGDRRLLVPVNALEVVADELLVEAGLRTARSIAVAGPEARRIGRERLVD